MRTEYEKREEGNVEAKPVHDVRWLIWGLSYGINYFKY